jgi:hypothetical protein
MPKILSKMILPLHLSHRRLQLKSYHPRLDFSSFFQLPESSTARRTRAEGGRVHRRMIVRKMGSKPHGNRLWCGMADAGSLPTGGRWKKKDSRKAVPM